MKRLLIVLTKARIGVAALVVSLATLGPLGAQPDCDFVPGRQAQGFELVRAFCSGWQRLDLAAGAAEPLVVPSAELKAPEILARLEPAFTAIPPDTLWLYFEGVAGEASIAWNGQLLDLTDDPLADRLVALPPGVIRLGINRLVVRMRPTGFTARAAPAPFTGLYRGVFLLRKKAASAAALPKRPLPAAPTALYAPWTPAGPRVDSATALRHLLWLRGLGFRSVVFAFPPDNRLRQQFEQLGLAVADSALGPVAHFNAYPSAEASRIPFWLDASGKPTAYFGSFWPADARLSQLPPRWTLLGISLLPLILLVGWKLGDGASFSALLTPSLIDRRAYEQIAKGATLRGVPVLLIAAIRLLLLAVLVMLLAMQLRSWGRPDIIPASPDSPLGQLLRLPLGSEWAYFGLVLLSVAGWQALKLLLVRVASAIYGIRQGPRRLMLIEALAAFPLLLVPVAFAFVVALTQPQGEWGWLLTRAAVWLAVGYSSLHFFFLARDLGRLFATPVLANVFYLCALEILPWLWLM